MKKFFTKLFASAMIVSMAFSMFVATAKAAVSIQLESITRGTYYYNTDVNLINSPNVTVTVAGGSLDYPSNITLGNEGAYSVVVRHLSDDSIVALQVNIDKTAPVIWLSGVSNNLITSQNVTPVFGANGGHVWATLNGGDFNSGTTITNEGNYRLVINAGDAAGNVTRPATDVMFTIKRGTTPPVNPPVVIQPITDNPSTNPIYGTTKTATTKQRFAKAATVETVSITTDTADATLSDVNITRVENADGLGGNLNSCRRTRIIGHAKEGLLVILYIEKNGSDVPIIGFVKAGAGDEYQFVTDKPLLAGEYTVFAKLAQEGGKTGPMIKVGYFRVEQCNRLLIWLWLLIILIVLIIAGIIGWLVSRRRRAQEEREDEDNDSFDDLDDLDETTDLDDSHKDRL